MRLLSSSLALSALLLVSGLAKADTFQFNLSSSGYTTSGILEGTNNNDGSYTITSITGNGITGLIPTGGSLPNDNLLFASNARQLDVNGLAFNAVIGGVNYQVSLYSDLAYNPPSNFFYYADSTDASGNFTDATATFNATAVTPEPSTLVLLGTGVLGVAAQLRRRFSAV